MNDTLYNDAVATKTHGVFTAQVFGWMTFGVAISAVVAFVVNVIALQSYEMYILVVGLALPALIIQLILAFVFGLLGRKLNVFLNIGLFVVFSIFIGFTLGVITLNYEVISIFISFGVSAAMFLVLALYGFFTKRDLSRWGSVALFALFGVILVSIINLILLALNSPLFSALDAILNYLIVIIFSILIATDTQKIKKFAAEAEMSGQSYTKLAILAALELYLDFVNLFIAVLRITGGKRR